MARRILILAAVILITTLTATSRPAKAQFVCDCFVCTHFYYGGECVWYVYGQPVTTDCLTWLYSGGRFPDYGGWFCLENYCDLYPQLC